MLNLPPAIHLDLNKRTTQSFLHILEVSTVRFPFFSDHRIKLLCQELVACVVFFIFTIIFKKISTLLAMMTKNVNKHIRMKRMTQKRVIAFLLFLITISMLCHPRRREEKFIFSVASFYLHFNLITALHKSHNGTVQIS